MIICERKKKIMLSLRMSSENANGNVLIEFRLFMFAKRNIVFIRSMCLNSFSFLKKNCWPSDDIDLNVSSSKKFGFGNSFKCNGNFKIRTNRTRSFNRAILSPVIPYKITTQSKFRMRFRRIDITHWKNHIFMHELHIISTKCYFFSSFARG